MYINVFPDIGTCSFSLLERAIVLSRGGQEERFTSSPPVTSPSSKLAAPRADSSFQERGEVTLSPKQRVACCLEETQISCPSPILRGMLAGSVWSRQPATRPAFHVGHSV